MRKTAANPNKVKGIIPLRGVGQSPTTFIR